MKQAVVTSKKGTLDAKDFTKGLLMAVLTPVVTTILLSIQAGNFVLDYRVLASIAAGALISYLSKNLGTPARIVITNPSDYEIETVEEGTASVSVKTPVRGAPKD